MIDLAGVLLCSFRCVTHLYFQNIIQPTIFKEKASSFDEAFLVPRTGFEPAHPCGRCDLNTVRLPISPSGRLYSGLQI
jgi:hypothetical protein